MKLKDCIIACSLFAAISTANASSHCTSDVAYALRILHAYERIDSQSISPVVLIDRPPSDVESYAQCIEEKLKAEAKINDKYQVTHKIHNNYISINFQRK